MGKNKNLYLHMGTPKTGTTALQHLWAKNREQMLLDGICYPDVGAFCRESGIDLGMYGENYPQNGAFFKQFCTREMEHFPMAEMLLNPSFQKIIDFLETCCENHDKVLLSEESLWLMDMSEFIQYFIDKGITVKIIVYLRRQDRYLESFWNQDVKNGFYDKTMMEFVRDRKKTAVVQHLYYAKMLEALEAIVGRENLYIRIYHKDRYQGAEKSIFSDFMNIFGIELTDDYVRPEKPVNHHLTKNALHLKLLFNSILKDTDYMRHVEPMFNMISERGVSDDALLHVDGHLDAEDRELCLSIFKEDNQKVLERYFPEETDGLFPDEAVATDTQIDQTELLEDVVRLFGTLLVKQQEQIDELRRQIK